LLESSQAYGGAMRIQRDRLALADWLRGMVDAGVDDPFIKLGRADGINCSLSAKILMLWK
jgi:hypothetical protein